MQPDSPHDDRSSLPGSNPVSRLADRVTRRFGADSRGAAEVIGAILMFGLVMSLLVLIQVNAVPAQNQQVEFEHNQRVQQDMLDFDRAILQSGTENVPTSTQVELAARYPSRFFLLNPGVGSGTIETLGPGTVTVSNAQAASASSYWDGSDRTFETTAVRYRPSYNEYANAPSMVYEHTTLVKTFESGTALPADTGSFIEGDQVLLLLVDGQLSTASTGDVAVDAVPLSAPARTTTITNADADGITLTLPTTLGEEQWASLLEGEMVANGGRISDIAVTSGDPYNTLTVTLEPGSYTLRMARVGVGSDVDESVLGPYYLTRAGEETTESIRTGETKRVRVQVNDRYNNPAAGDVTFTATDGQVQGTDGTWAESVTKPSNESGTVSVLYRPDSSFVGTGSVTAEQDFDGDSTVDARERTSFDIPVESATGGDGTGGGSVSQINPAGANNVELESVELVKGQQNSVAVTFRNTGATDREIDRMRLLFFMANSGDIAQSATVNGDARDTIQLFGDYDDIDQEIVVPAGSTETITFTFTDAGNKDLFGLTIDYNEYSANYFIQVP
ncbi:hypothetical protein ACFQJ5_05270 [Halomicroarcula sp. GCM10025324]|uniref:hypothetical protein n=1 Tax=Haloarcula TaxID=2237 RepID=UPI0023E8595F|nr:hypothetical protein [Halomicroarcula sp. ZS-22-S1]